MDETVRGPEFPPEEGEHEEAAALPVDGGTPPTWWHTGEEAPWPPSTRWQPWPDGSAANEGPTARDVPANENQQRGDPSWDQRPAEEERQPVWDPPPSWGPPPLWGVEPSAVVGAGADDGPDGGTQPEADAGPGDGHPDQPRRLRRLVLLGLGVILVVGAVAGGVLIGRSSNPQHTTTASETIPPPGNSGSPGTSAKINVAAIAARLDQSVVDITSILGASSTGDGAAGTGMILTSNGEVLTNNHVIADATSVTAQINGAGRVYKVLVLGTDVSQDVALVQLVGASGLPTVSIGDSSKLQIGDPVVAIGNALDLKGPETVTQGIVSALGRSITASDAGTGTTENLSGLIQTDAPINPGNSGGPLVNANGQVVGMDTAAASGSSTQSATDIGFAIPINTAIHIAQQIQQSKGSSTITIDDKGFLGVQVVSISEAESAANGLAGQVPPPGASSGAYVAGVLEGTPAMQAGLRLGDVITAVNGKAVSNPQSLGTILGAERPGESVTVTWVRPNKTHQSATVTLTAHPVA